MSDTRAKGESLQWRRSDEQETGEQHRGHSPRVTSSRTKALQVRVQVQQIAIIDSPCSSVRIYKVISEAGAEELRRARVQGATLARGEKVLSSSSGVA